MRNPTTVCHGSTPICHKIPGTDKLTTSDQWQAVFVWIIIKRVSLSVIYKPTDRVNNITTVGAAKEESNHITKSCTEVISPFKGTFRKTWTGFASILLLQCTGTIN